MTTKLKCYFRNEVSEEEILVPAEVDVLKGILIIHHGTKCIKISLENILIQLPAEIDREILTGHSFICVNGDVISSSSNSNIDSNSWLEIFVTFRFDLR